MPTAGHARAAVQTWRSLGAFTAEIRIGHGLPGFLSLAREENRHLGRMKFIFAVDFLRDALQHFVARA